MQLNRFTARLLLFVLLPFVLLLKLLRLVTGEKTKPEYVSTIEGDPLAYNGDRPLVIAIWASWASVWTVATEKAVEELKAEFSGRCEFVYVEAGDKKQAVERFKADVVPLVLVYRNGREIARFANLLQAEPVRHALVQQLVP